jgi:protein SCO1/2
MLWEVPPFAFEDAEGRVIRNASLRGHVWVADFIFTQCTSFCPIITAEMTLLRRTIRSPSVRFVSFSIEPEFDTPQVLKAYATRWDADPRWLLLRPDPARIADFARAMHVAFKRGPDPEEPLLHTSLFFLVDGAGRVRGLYSSLDEPAVARLVADANRLDGNALGAPGFAEVASSRASPAAASASRGFDLFRSVGCSACHSDPRIAPPLADLVGATVALAGEQSIVADDAYLRESILDPARKVVAGYNPLMPPYRGHLTGDEVDDLVAYVHSLRERAGEPGLRRAATTGRTAAEVRDPVCGMQVTPSLGSPKADYLGKTFYFCGDPCRARFEHDPARYVP